MYSTGEELEKAINDGKPLKKEIRFADDSSTVISTIKALKLYSGSNSSNEIQIGTTNSSYIEAEVVYDGILANKEIMLYAGIDEEMIPMGIYKILQIPTEKDGIVSFKAYDNMRLLDELYEPTIDLPNSFKNVVTDIAKQCNVATDFNYTSGTITKDVKGYTCREMIGYIASMLGMFAYFDRNGMLQFSWYNISTPIKKELCQLWSLTKDSDDYTVTGVEFEADSETSHLSGEGPNIIYCSNPFATKGDADNVHYGILNNFTCRPAEISMLDDIRLDVTDVIQITTIEGADILVPCMTLNQNFTACETIVKAVGNSNGESGNYSGPITNAVNRLTTELLVTNRVVATKVDADWVRANTVTADKIVALQAEIETLNAKAITTDNLKAKTAELGYMTANEADIKYANIELTNIATANVAKLFTEVGLIDNATIVEGHITGYLDSVQVNANNITAGTLVADRILLRGTDKSLLYALNNLGELTSTTMDSLDGDVLTDRTISADKIIANSITANELNIDKIFGNEAVINQIFAQDITASGTITGAKLYGTTIEALEGNIANFKITSDGLYRELDWVTSTLVAPYKAWCEIYPNSPGYVNMGAGSGALTFNSPSYRQGYYEKGTDSSGNETVEKKISFETHMYGMRTDYFEAERINSDLIAIPTSDAVPTPSGYEYTYYSLGKADAPWQNVYARSIYAKKSLTSGTGTIYAEGDIIAGLGTGKQVSLQGIKDDLTGGGSAYFSNQTSVASSLKASTNTVIYSFKILKTGTYMFIPAFRTTVPSGHIFSVGVFNYNNLQYPTTQYEDICTMIGTGKKHSMNGIQIFTATAGTIYYVIGYATSAITLDSNNWFHLYCLKTT